MATPISASALLWRTLVSVLLSMLACHRNAHAELQFCVADSNQFQSALQGAADAASAATIRVVQGNYAGISFPGQLADRLAIYGGYAAGCSVRVLDPANTVVQVTGFGVGDFSGLSDDLVFEGLTFQMQTVNGFFLVADQVSGHGIFLRNNVFENLNSNSDGAVWVRVARSDAISVVVQNNRVTNWIGALGCALFVQNFDDDASVDAYITNNTVANNNLGTDNFGINAGVCVETAGNVSLYNNIFYGNAGVDLHNRSSQADPPWLLVDNIIGTSANLPALDTASSGDSTSNPQFVAPASGDYHLLDASPAINSGDLTPQFGLTAVDLDGQPRVVGTHPDRGAYESAVNDAPGFAISVTSNADSGAGTLRQAIINANAAGGAHVVSFDIAGPCPQTITLAGPLDALTASYFFRGFTEPGSSPNTADRGDNATRCIVLDGHLLTSGQGFGLFHIGGSGSFLNVDGMAFEGFKNAAIELRSGTGTITGNQFGGSVGAVALAANGIDLSLAGSSRSNVGGPNPAQRNIISGASVEGIEIPFAVADDSTGNTILGNLIGTGADGNSAAPNTTGLFVQTAGNAIFDNTISGNLLFGIQLDGVHASAMLAYGNLIGVKGGYYLNFPGFTPALGNAAGIVVSNGASGNLVSGNTVAYNDGDGISLFSGAGLHNRLTTNRIYLNGQYGIDLAGASSNDDDAGAGAANLPNRGLNFPAISALGGSHGGRFSASLASIVDTYSIQFFWNPACPVSGHAQGQFPIGTLTLAITSALPGQNGTGVMQGDLYSSIGLFGGGITATATDAQGNTSDFSACVPYQSDVIFADSFD